MLIYCYIRRWDSFISLCSPSHQLLCLVAAQTLMDDCCLCSRGNINLGVNTLSIKLRIMKSKNELTRYVGDVWLLNLRNVNYSGYWVTKSKKKITSCSSWLKGVILESASIYVNDKLRSSVTIVNKSQLACCFLGFFLSICNDIVDTNMFFL